MKYITALILFCLSFTTLKAQTTLKMKFGIDHYAINVVDLDQSVHFYQTVFQLEEIYDGTELDHIRWFRLGNSQELHIISVSDLKLQIPKGVHLALTTADLKAFITYLEKIKIPYFNWPGKEGAISIRPDTVQQIYIQDPDGYWIEINDGIKRF